MDSADPTHNPQSRLQEGHYEVTVGTPNVLTPTPPGLGISTALTAGGKYVPDDIRFQILYRLLFRSFSNASIDTPSTPAAPLLLRTFSNAYHTNRFEIVNGLPSGCDPLIRLLPGTLVDR